MAKVRRPINAPASSKIPKELVAIAIIAVAAAAYYYGTQKDEAKADAGEGAASAYVTSAAAHGPADAPIVIAKWTDFQ